MWDPRMEIIIAGGNVWILQTAVSDGNRQRSFMATTDLFPIIYGGVYFVGSSS